MPMPLKTGGQRKPSGAVRARTLKAALVSLAAVIVCAFPVAAPADHAHKGSGGPAGFGALDFGNSCARAVQAEFRTAIAVLHSFAAEPKQFVDVANHDASCAMAWWGAAMAARGNPLVGEPDRDGLQAGQGYLAHAQRLKTTPRERAFLDAMEVYYREYPNGGQLARARAYEAAMEGVFRENPNDVEAAAFYGLAIVEAVDLNSRNYDQQSKAGQVLEALLAQHPYHPCGLNYLIHAYDFAPLATRGLPAARRYAAAAPAP